MTRLALVAVVLLAAGPILAQTPAPAPQTSAPIATDDTTPKSPMDQRIARMRERLKITPAQESSWNAFARVMRDNVTSADQAYKNRAASIATMSAPDNMRNFAQIEQARAQGVQNLAASFETLYGTFSEDQKKIADAMFRHYEDRATAPRHAPK